MPATSARPSAIQPRRDDERSTPRASTSAGAEQEQHGQPGLEGGSADRRGPEQADERDPGHGAQEEDAHGR